MENHQTLYFQLWHHYGFSVSALRYYKYFSLKSQINPAVKIYQIYIKFFIYTKSNFYIPNTLKIYETFEIWCIYIYISWQHWIKLRNSRENQAMCGRHCWKHRTGQWEVLITFSLLASNNCFKNSFGADVNSFLSAVTCANGLVSFAMPDAFSILVSVFSYLFALGCWQLQRKL